MKRPYLILATILLWAACSSAQGTLEVTLEYTVSSPWQTPCSTTVLTNCVQGWRVIDTTGGGRTVLHDIAAPTTGFTGVVTAVGSGPVPTPTGTVVAQTVGIDSSGGERLSPDSDPVPFGKDPDAPTISKATIVI